MSHIYYYLYEIQREICYDNFISQSKKWKISHTKERICIVLLQENRVKYNQQHYMKVFKDEESKQMLADSITSPPLLTLLEVQIVELICFYLFLVYAL